MTLREFFMKSLVQHFRREETLPHHALLSRNLGSTRLRINRVNDIQDVAPRERFMDQYVLMAVQVGILLNDPHFNVRR